MTVREIEDRTTTVGPAEAARRLGIQPTTLANLRWSGRGPRFVKIGSRVRYRLVDIEKFLDRQTRTSTSDRGPHA